MVQRYEIGHFRGETGEKLISPSLPFPVEQFTQRERELLAPFVTNTDRPVFCLTKLPQEVKGALFARYSRSPQTLRRTLLEDFIEHEDIGILLIAEQIEREGVERAVALAKARKIFEKYFLDFDHRSIAEQGNVHIAFEFVTNTATKVIEDARLGVSPLEKSSRYVDWSEQIGGKYLYCRDSLVFENPRLAVAYEETADFLFDAYAETFKRAGEYLRKKYPIDDFVFKDQEGNSKPFDQLSGKFREAAVRAYNQAVHGRSCEIARSFLPVCTVTNLGVAVNGNAAEYLLTKMKGYRGPNEHEIWGLADMAYGELEKIAPFFVENVVGDKGNRWQEYLATNHERMHQLAEEILLEYPRAGDKRSVVLVVPHNIAETNTVAAAFFPYTDRSLQHLIWIATSLGYEKRKRVMDAYFGERKSIYHKPGRALEITGYDLIYELLIPFAVYRDLQRHRVLSQQRQEPTVIHGFETPEEYQEIGIEKVYQEAQERAGELFEKIKSVFPRSASNISIFGALHRSYFAMNPREMIYLTELRSQKGGDPVYRRIAQEMARLGIERYPWLKDRLLVDWEDYRLGRLESAQRGELKRLNLNYGNP